MNIRVSTTLYFNSNKQFTYKELLLVVLRLIYVNRMTIRLDELAVIVFEFFFIIGLVYKQL